MRTLFSKWVIPSSSNDKIKEFKVPFLSFCFLFESCHVCKIAGLDFTLRIVYKNALPINGSPITERCNTSQSFPTGSSCLLFCTRLFDYSTEALCFETTVGETDILSDMGFKKTRRKCVMCSFHGYYDDIELHIFTREYICKKCAGCWRRREMVVYQGADGSGRVSLLPFPGAYAFQVMRFKNCSNRYKFPLLARYISQGYKSISNNSKNQSNGNTSQDENEIGNRNKSRNFGMVVKRTMTSNSIDPLNMSRQSYDRTPFTSRFPALQQQQHQVERSAEPERGGAPLRFDVRELNVAFVMGTKLLESVEEITNSVGQAISRVQHAEDSLALLIRNERTSVLRQQREIKRELAELKITLQKFKFRNIRQG